MQSSLLQKSFSHPCSSSADTAFDSGGKKLTLYQVSMMTIEIRYSEAEFTGSPPPSVPILKKILQC